MPSVKVISAALLIALASATSAVATSPSTTARGASGQVLTVSKSSQLPPKGSWITVTGKRYDETVGIYVALCVLTKKGTKTIKVVVGGKTFTSKLIVK